MRYQNSAGREFRPVGRSVRAHHPSRCYDTVGRSTGDLEMRTAAERWTEAELANEIRRLAEQIERAAENDTERSRNAVSYLQQVLQDRKRTLAVLKQKRVRPLH